MLLVREFDPAGALAFSSAFLANFGANCPQLQPKLRATDESFDLPAFLKLASAKNHPPYFAAQNSGSLSRVSFGTKLMCGSTRKRFDSMLIIPSLDAFWSAPFSSSVACFQV